MATLKDWLQADVGDIVTPLRSAWEWWKGEISSLLPTFIRQRLFPEKTYLVVAFADDELVLHPSALKASLPRLSENSARKSAFPSAALRPGADAPFDGTVVCLQPSQTIRMQTRYPRTSSANLRRMIDFDLPRLCPLDPALVYFGFRALPSSGTDAVLQDVEVWICQRSLINRIVSRCAELQLRPVGLTLPQTAPALLIANFFPLRQLNFKEKIRAGRTPALAGLATVLAFCIAAVAQMREASFNETLENELQRKRTIVQAIEKDRAQVQQLERRRDFLLRQRQAMQAGQALSELARILPDSAWIYNLEYGKSEIRIRGFANRANELIPALDASRLFSAAQFRSPVVGAPNGSDRFDIAVRVGEQP